MADDTRKHITVTPDDEDDFVIRAGVSSIQPDATDGAGDGLAVGAKAGGVFAESGAEAAPESADLSASSGAHQVEKPASPDAADRDGYRETTLADIESADGMSKMQGVIIGLAVVAILAFILYYNVAMR
ncbi:MAG: hypothetical protein SOW20_03170 [Berryella intestinalis]|uniref:hypothetical protein n=1 Tax=Berryella intestinalis TaxID=1531429 RepID=UPI002A523C94|nr:hypothetical protein [Berryella intestinalis]MDD7369314.1 hypothetical protein [Berryella intestinalis]MDY3129012.1 hypothetical protein [Berryella intestinalis]